MKAQWNQNNHIKEIQWITRLQRENVKSTLENNEKNENPTHTKIEATIKKSYRWRTQCIENFGWKIQ